MKTDELRALLAKVVARDAEPEPWQEHSTMNYSICLPDDRYLDLSVHYAQSHDHETEVRDLIVAAVNELPALLDRLDAAEKDAARLRNADAEAAERHEQILDADAQQTAVWNYLQRVSPWSESNDMLWADEIITGIDQLLHEARKYRWLRDRANSVIDWDFMPKMPDDAPSPLDLGCSGTLDAILDAALQATASERGGCDGR